MPKNCSQITSYLNEFLEVARIKDSSYNGLQLEGKENIDKIAFAVDAGVEVFEKAKQINADMLVVHHGIFWDRIDPRLVGVNKKRLDILLSANINLYAAHLPLDMHDKVGNNVSLVKMIGAEPAGRFWNYNGNFIAALGKFPLPQKTSQLAQIIEDKLKTKVHVLGEDKEVLTLAAASGGVSLDAINEAKAVGADLLIVGEMRDFYHLAKDSDISVIFAGHHASEQAGIWALQKHVAKEFPDLECVYIECPTGL